MYSMLMHPNCDVIEDCSSCHGWTGKRTNVIDMIGSILMLRNSMTDMNMRFFGHIV